MTVRENVHRLIDALPEDRLSDVYDYIADLRDDDASFSPETSAAIEEGLDDLRIGRAMSLADYRRTRGLRNTKSGYPTEQRKTWTASIVIPSSAWSSASSRSAKRLKTRGSPAS